MLRIPNELEIYSVIQDDDEAVAVAERYNLDSAAIREGRHVLLQSHSGRCYVLYRLSDGAEEWLAVRAPFGPRSRAHWLELIL